MNKIMRCVLFGVTLVAAAAISESQTSLKLTLGESIDMAMSKGLVASDVRARYEAAKDRAEASRRASWTSVALSVNAPSYSQSLSQQFNPATGSYEYYQLQSTDYQGSLVINQPLTLTGGTLRLSQSLLGRSQTSGLSGLGSSFKNYFGDLGVELDQPLLSGNRHRINARRGDIAIQQAESDFTSNELDLVYRVTESFFTLYQSIQQLDIVKEQVKQNEESYRTASSKFTGGLIPEVDVMQSEVDLASSRNDSLKNERQLAQTKNAFRLLLGIPPEVDVEPAGDITYSPVTVERDSAIAMALRYRPEVLRADWDIQLRELDVDEASTQNSFRLDLSARYGVNKTDTLFRDVFRDLNRSRSASLTLSVPLFDWGRNGRMIEAAEIDYRNSKAQKDYVIQQIRQETMDLLDRIEVAKSRIEVLQKSVAVGQQGYDISTQRFRNGTITRNDLAQAQQRLTAAKLNSLSALIDYKLAVADLERKTHWDYEKNSPVQHLLRSAK